MMADREASDGSGGTDARLRGIGCAGPSRRSVDAPERARCIASG
jgi:hypothetical protein